MVMAGNGLAVVHALTSCGPINHPNAPFFKLGNKGTNDKRPATGFHLWLDQSSIHAIIEGVATT